MEPIANYTIFSVEQDVLCDLYVALSNICYVLCDQHVVICKMYYPIKMWLNVPYDQNVVLDKMFYLK